LVATQQSPTSVTRSTRPIVRLFPNIPPDPIVVAAVYGGPCKGMPNSCSALRDGSYRPKTLVAPTSFTLAIFYLVKGGHCPPIYPSNGMVRLSHGAHRLGNPVDRKRQTTFDLTPMLCDTTGTITTICTCARKILPKNSLLIVDRPSPRCHTQPCSPRNSTRGNPDATGDPKGYTARLIS
jgi:hypothetical protein